MTVREWIRGREIDGHLTFSFAEVKGSFCDMPEQYLKNSLYRFAKQGEIMSVHKGFYTIIPAHYKLRGMVPATFYIDHLFRYLGRPYYISLLSAAEMHGAAHQRPQKFNVTTTLPAIQTSSNKNAYLCWNFRNHIEQSLLLEKNSETGTVRYSNPELTAVDLIQYESQIGGLSVAATVLDELLESVDFNRNFDSILSMTTLAVMQRLGYIIDVVLEYGDLALTLHQRLVETGRRLNFVPLKPGYPIDGCVRDEKWKTIINQEIEIDDI